MQKSNSAVLQLLDKASDLYYAGTPIISDIEFDRLAEENNFIAMFAGGIDITSIPEICTKPSLAQYLLNEINSTIKWNENKIGDNAKSSLMG